MRIDLDSLVELNRQLAVEEDRGDAAREIDVEIDVEDGWFDDTFDRRDFVLLMISIAILAFGIWWVTPW